MDEKVENFPHLSEGKTRDIAAEKAGFGNGESYRQAMPLLNLRRRHLDESQRAMAATKLANLGEGRQSATASIEAVSQSAAADMLNVSRRTVQAARSVIDDGESVPSPAAPNS